MSEISHLHQEVSPEQLDEATAYNVSIVDSVSGKVVQQYEVATKINNPFAFDPSPFVPKDRIMDLPAFYNLAADIILDAQARDSIVEEERVSLVQEYQPDRFHSLGDEVISAKVIKREPANMSTKATSRPQRHAAYDFEYQSPSEPNKSIVIKSRPVDHIIEFACWARTATLANSRALWLEKLFTTHSWAFGVQGVERFHWKTRGPDTLWNHGGQRLHQRPLQFFVRLREHEVFAHPILRRTDFEISTI